MSESLEPETGEMIVKRVSVPIGLEELMEGLAKEVLLKKPDDIYLFAADYFSRLLLLREKGPYKSKPYKTAQSVAKQTPKPPLEKLLVRGASKQLSRQISVRGESPTKIAPMRRPPARLGRDEKDTNRSKFIDRKNKAKKAEAEAKRTESKLKQIPATPRPLADHKVEEKQDTLSKRDRSLSTSRRGRSSSRNLQSTPRQKSTPIKSASPFDNEKSGKVRGNEKSKLEKDKEKSAVLPVSSVEESHDFVKDGKLTVIPPKIIKPVQSSENKEITSLVVPHVIEHIVPIVEVSKEDKNTKEQSKFDYKDETKIKQSKIKGNKNKASAETTDKDADNKIEEGEDIASVLDKSTDNKAVYDSKGNKKDEKKSSLIDSLEMDNSIESSSLISDETDRKSTTLSEGNKTESSVTNDSSTGKSIKSAAHIKESKPVQKSEELKAVTTMKMPVDVKDTVEEIFTDSKRDDSVAEAGSSVSDDTKKEKGESVDDVQKLVVVETKKPGILKDNLENENTKKLHAAKDFNRKQLDSKSDTTNDILLKDQSSRDDETGSEKKSVPEHKQEKTTTSNENKILDKDITKTVETNINIDRTGDKSQLQQRKTVITNATKEKDNDLPHGDMERGKLEKKTDIDKDIAKKVDNVKEIKGSAAKEDVDKKEMESKADIDKGNNTKESQDFLEKDPKKKNKVSEQREQVFEKEKVINNVPDIKKVENKSLPKGSDEDKSDITVLETNISKTSNEDSKVQNELIPSSTDGETITSNKSLLITESVDKVDNIAKKEEGNVSTDKSKIKETKTQDYGRSIDNDNMDFHTDKISGSDEQKLPEDKSFEIENKKSSEDTTHNKILHTKSENRETHKKSEGESSLLDSNKKSHEIKTDILKTKTDESEIPHSLKTDGKEKLKSIDKEIEEKSRESSLETNKKYSGTKDPEQIKSEKLQSLKSDVEDNLEYTHKTSEESSGSISDINKTSHKDDIKIAESEKLDRDKSENGESDVEAELNLVHKTDEESDGKILDPHQTNTRILEDEKVDPDNTEGKSETKEKHKPILKIGDEVNSSSISDSGEKSHKIDTKVSEGKKIELHKQSVKSEKELVHENNKPKIISNLKSDQSESNISQNVKSDTQEIEKHIQKKSKNVNSSTASDPNKKSLDTDEKHDNIVNINNKKSKTILDVQNGDVKVDTAHDSSEIVSLDKKSVSFSDKASDPKYNESDSISSDKKSKDISTTKTYQISEEELSIGKETSNSVKDDDQKVGTDYESHANNLSKDDTVSETNVINKEQISVDPGKVSKEILQEKPPQIGAAAENVSVIQKIIEQTANIKENTSTEDKWGLHDAANIITSVINVVDGSMDNKVKTFIDTFINNEKEHVFVKKCDENTITDNLGGTSKKNQLKKEENVPLETKDLNKSADHYKEGDILDDEKMKQIITSTMAVEQTGHVEEIVKKHINDFLKNEKENVDKYKDDNIDNESLNKNIKNGIITTDSKLDSNKESITEGGNSHQDESMKKPESDKSSKGESSANIKGKDYGTDEKKTKEDRNIRRIKTVDVIRDRSKDKTEVKTRIPTADYRSRVKRDSEHSVRIKRSDSFKNSKEVHQFNKNGLPAATLEKSTTSVVGSSDKGEILTGDINKSGSAYKGKDKQLEKKTDTGSIEQKETDDKQTKSSEKLKISQAVKPIENGIKISNEEPDSLKEIISAIKIQALWRGFKVRKIKKDAAKKQYVDKKTDNLLEQHTEKIHMSDVEATIDRELRSDKQVQDKEQSQQSPTNSKNQSPNLGKGKVEIGSSGIINEIELGEAATVIQKNWRGFNTRKNLKGADLQKTPIEIETDDKRNVGHHEVSKDMKKSEASRAEISQTEKFEAIVKAAKSIQKAWRTFKQRKSTLKSKYVRIDRTEECSEVKEKAKSKVLDNGKESINDLLDDNIKDKEMVCHQINIVDDKRFRNAAITIQKIFRGFKVRKQFKKDLRRKKRELKSDSKTGDGSPDPTKKKVTDTENTLLKKDVIVKETIEDLKQASPSETNDFVKAAILIQKMWRGFKVRKPTKKDFKIKSEGTNGKSLFKSEEIKNNLEISMPQELPCKEIKEQNLTSQTPMELKTEQKFNKAAALIQKLWRGFKVRKNFDLKNISKIASADGRVAKQSNLETKVGTSKATTENDFIKAAILIQKIWRGFKVRKLLNVEKYHKTEISKPFTSKLVRTETFQKTPKTEAIKSEEEFVKAAVLIQKIWRGFKVRKNLYKDNSKQKVEKNNEIHVDKQKLASSQTEESNEKFVKAAIMIQKIWRGFKVRKSAPTKNVFGKPVETEKPVIETVKEADPKDKKSALKIQSLWRGYQVRKNINVIKNKLEDELKDDVGRRKELTDGDILNAATKIQAGVRGYLQRKKYKTTINKLNIISEEDTTSDKSPKDDYNKNKLKLSDEDVLKALEHLNKLEIPKDIPSTREVEKPKFYRSETVQEPEIIKKDIPLLLKSASVNHIPNVNNFTLTTLNKDSNNNTADKSKELTPLEKEVKEAVAKIVEKGENKLNEIPDGIDKTKDNDIIKITQDAVTHTPITHTPLSNDGSSESIDVNRLHIDTHKTIVGSSNADKYLKHKIEPKIEPKIEQTSDKGEEISPVRNVNEDCANAVQKTKEESSVSNDEVDSKLDNNVSYERPLSIDSNDSAVTVIYNDKGHENSRDEPSDDTLRENENTKTSLSEEETLINNFQNKLLEQISGKTGSTGNCINKFDIDQLRKELEEAGLMHNNDTTHIRHENSREIPDDHDHLLDYLEGFELSTENDTTKSNETNNYGLSSPRDLPGIKEEDHTKQSDVPIQHDINQCITENDINIEKIKSTLKECESIAREINKGFENIDENGHKVSDNKSPSEHQNILRNNLSDQLFCRTSEKMFNNESIPDDVEIITPQQLHLANEEKSTDHKEQAEPDSTSENSRQNYTENSKPQNELLHSGELHDFVLLKKSTDLEAKPQLLHDYENADVGLSTHIASETSKSKLLHTGELHDTVVIPLPLRVQENLEIEKDKHKKITVAKNSSPLPLEPNMNANGLLHTGEIHHTLVVPTQSLDTHEKNCVNIHKPVEEHLSDPMQNTEPKLPVKQPTRLMHTGELHDTVVIPISKMVQMDPGHANTDDGEEDSKPNSDDGGKVPRQVDSECQTNGEPSIAVQLSDVPAGVETLTSPRPVCGVPNVSDVDVAPAQAPDKGALPNVSSSDFSSPSHLQSMESKNCTKATVDNKTMAATKIQAGFRGYQVRKQLKLKNGSSDINNQRRQLRRKSSGRLTETGRTTQNKPKDANEVEEKSAVKIQAGVRGFLVRRRQKKLKNQES